MEIQIKATKISNDKLLSQLQAYGNNGMAGYKLELRDVSIQLRGIDPTVLVAIVGVVSTGLGALITGLLRVAQQTAAKKIILQSKNGQRIELPSDLSPEKVDEWIEKLKKMDGPTILLL
ncbi:MAG: hypothetical protein ACFFCW_03515 [Candidatus Hodarchaeota archaeon]